jgi:lipoate-protein ligase B
VNVLDLGTAPYQDVWQRQLALVEARRRDEVGDTLILVEHPHVITVGRRRDAEGNVVAAGDVPVALVERGGDVTYHGPGQLVAYPILLLAEGERDLHRFLRNLEEGIMLALADVGLPAAGRRAGETGVWVGPRKIASIGVACRRWVTFHGLALNVATELGYFARIRPCGYAPDVMTSASVELGRTLAVDEVKPPLVARLRQTLDRPLSRP